MTANNETGIIMVRVCTTLIQYYTTYMLFILGDGCQNSQYVGHPLQIEKNILSVFLCGSESMWEVAVNGWLSLSFNVLFEFQA